RNRGARSAKRRDCRTATPRYARAARGRRSARAPTPAFLLPHLGAPVASPRRWCCRPCHSGPVDRAEGASDAAGSSNKEGGGRSLRPSDDRSREQEEEQGDDRGDEHHTLELSRERTVEAADGLI